MDAWRRLLEQMTAFTEQAAQITEKYGSDDWEQAVSTLWQKARDQVMANPLNLPTLHRDVGEQLTDLQQQLEEWLKNRREDYEQQRERYEQVLNHASVEIRLRIPFNPQHPAESYDALVETVQQHLSRYLDDLQRRLNATLQTMRYATLVRQVDLTDVERQANETMGEVEQLQQRLSPDLLRDMARAEANVLQPLQQVFEGEKAVTAEVQHALQKRAPDEAEAELLELLQTITPDGEADLYSLIMHQIDQGDAGIELDQLMQQLQSLFQKNQIGIRIRVL